MFSAPSEGPMGRSLTMNCLAASWPERIIAFLAAALLVLEYNWTDPIGFAACGAFIAYQFWKARRTAVVKPAE
jgi:hypothetical protein